MKISLLTNFTSDLLAVKLTRSQIETYIPQGFDTWKQEVLDINSPIYGDCDAVVVLIDDPDFRIMDVRSIIDRVKLWKQAIVTLCDNTENGIVVLSTVSFCLSAITTLREIPTAYKLKTEWMIFLSEMVNKYPFVTILDVERLIDNIGRNIFYSDKMWYLGSSPYSSIGIKAIEKEIIRIMDSISAPRKKCLILDLDNTLWGGVIGEDGIDGIKLSEHGEGQCFKDFQRRLSEIKDKGILLAINSKNNFDDAMECINHHPDMILRGSDFSAMRINWTDKATNVKEICRELNILECSVVFIDDNPIERELVKGECPEVVVPEFPSDSSQLISFISECYLDYFQLPSVTDEDRLRTEMYRAEKMRNAEYSTAHSLEEYLSTLELSIKIQKMHEEELERVVRLCGKTNQFNTTTIRYTKKEIKGIIDDGGSVFVGYVADRFGKSGLVVIAVVKEYADHVEIDDFLMSCRVMGRNIEYIFANRILMHYKGLGKSSVHARYVKTKKNMPVSELFEKCGFKISNATDEFKEYSLELSDYEKIDFPYIKSIEFNWRETL